MNATKLLTALMAVLVVSAGAGAVSAASIDAETTEVDASYDDGTVSLTVTENDTGVANVSVVANGEDVGATDANGSLTFETNSSEGDELELELTKDGETITHTYEITDDGELVEADEEDETDEESELSATATYDNETVDVSVTQNDSAAENVSVSANGEDVGTTDANGSLAFDVNLSDGDELELEFEKDDMELEQEYVVEDGSLVLEEDDEESEDGNVSLSANENASDQAHSVLAVIQNYLNSGGEGNLGQQIQEAVGGDRGNADEAPGQSNADNASENANNGNGNAGDAPGQSDEADENENANSGNGNAGDAPGNSGNGNAPDDAGDDEEEDDEEEDDDDDDESDE